MDYCNLFLISSASVRSLLFLSFILLILAYNVLLMSPIFLTLSHSIIFLYFFAFFIEEGLLISLFSFLELCIQLGISPCLLLLFFSVFCKASSDSHFAFLHFFFMELLWSLPPVQCYRPLSIVLQALSLSDQIPLTYSSPPLYSHKAHGQVIPEWPSCFPYFLQFKYQFHNKQRIIPWTEKSVRIWFIGLQSQA